MNKSNCCEKCQNDKPLKPNSWHSLCPCHTQTTPSEESWEKEFDEMCSTNRVRGYSDTTKTFRNDVKDFIRETRTTAYEEGVRHGEGTGNGVQRYQMGYEQGVLDSLMEILKNK